MKKLFLIFALYCISKTCYSQIDSSLFFTQEVFTDVDEAASFVGGDSAYSNYIKKNCVYPPLAKKYNKTDKVQVAFYIDTTGAILYPRVVKGQYPDLNKEAIRLIKNMPKWNAAIKNGIKVNSAAMLGVIFYMSESEIEKIKPTYDYWHAMASEYLLNKETKKAFQLYYALSQRRTYKYEEVNMPYLKICDSIAMAHNLNKVHCLLIAKMNELKYSVTRKEQLIEECGSANLPYKDESLLHFFDTIPDVILPNDYNDENHCRKIFYKYRTTENQDILIVMTYLIDTSGNVSNFQFINCPSGIDKQSVIKHEQSNPYQSSATFNGKQIPVRDIKIYAVNNSSNKVESINSSCTFYTEGLKMFEKEEYEKAINRFDNSIITCGKFSITYLSRGQCYLKLNKPEEACKDFNEALKMGDQKAEFYINKYCK